MPAMHDDAVEVDLADVDEEALHRLPQKRHRGLRSISQPCHPAPIGIADGIASSWA